MHLFNAKKADLGNIYVWCMTYEEEQVCQDDDKCDGSYVGLNCPPAIIHLM